MEPKELAAESQEIASALKSGAKIPGKTCQQKICVSGDTRKVKKNETNKQKQLHSSKNHVWPPRDK